MQHARDRIRDLTVRSRLLLSLRQVVGEVNRFLLGWASYFRYGNSTGAFSALSWYAGRRLQLWWGSGGDGGDAIARIRFPLPRFLDSSRFLDASLHRGLIGRGGAVPNAAR